ncbi:hypothetical protein P280DRAFT_508901 [Massarina eburnea CBS 473.64]|uniref:Uncharacterized protein n=1 Tax=Massarina eburnea CBS 473.64 TaxID=1395130 RepID=A0A6A6RTF5_9PLEO|nr:hypothetical protein P280DRAFT_508901 [Massarina eburnea CBS 473.64]
MPASLKLVRMTWLVWTSSAMLFATGLLNHLWISFRENGIFESCSGNLWLQQLCPRYSPDGAAIRPPFRLGLDKVIPRVSHATICTSILYNTDTIRISASSSATSSVAPAAATSVAHMATIKTKGTKSPKASKVPLAKPQYVSVGVQLFYIRNYDVFQRIYGRKPTTRENARHFLPAHLDPYVPHFEAFEMPASSVNCRRLSTEETGFQTREFADSSKALEQATERATGVAANLNAALEKDGYHATVKEKKYIAHSEAIESAVKVGNDGSVYYDGEHESIGRLLPNHKFDELEAFAASEELTANLPAPVVITADSQAFLASSMTRASIVVAKDLADKEFSATDELDVDMDASLCDEEPIPVYNPYYDKSEYGRIATRIRILMGNDYKPFAEHGNPSKGYASTDEYAVDTSEFQVKVTDDSMGSRAFASTTPRVPTRTPGRSLASASSARLTAPPISVSADAHMMLLSKKQRAEEESNLHLNAPRSPSPVGYTKHSRSYRDSTDGAKAAATNPDDGNEKPEGEKKMTRSTTPTTPGAEPTTTRTTTPTPATTTSPDLTAVKFKKRTTKKPITKRKGYMSPDDEFKKLSIKLKAEEEPSDVEPNKLSTKRKADDKPSDDEAENDRPSKAPRPSDTPPVPKERKRGKRGGVKNKRRRY